MSVVAGSVCTPKSEKYKINSFLSKLNINDNNETDIGVDVAEIAVVLQTIGFKLLRFEKIVPNDEDNEIIKEGNDLIVSITCGKSGLKTVLARQDYECNCTNIKLSKKNEDCQTEISNENYCKEEFKLVIPKISTNDLNITRGILSYLFSNTKPTDVNQIEDVQTPLGDFPLNQPEENDNKKLEDNWEVDPKTSPPTLTSSPITKSEISEEPTKNLDKDLEQVLSDAKISIEKALSYISKNNTFTKRNVKRVSNIAKVPQSPRTPRRESISICNETATIKRAPTPRKYTPSPLNCVKKISNSSNIISVKMTPKLEKKISLPSKIGSLRNFSDRNICDDKKKTLIRTDTPRPGSITPKTQTKYSPMNLNMAKNGTINQPINKHHIIDKNKSPFMKPKSSLPSLSKIPNFAYKKLTSNK